MAATRFPRRRPPCGSAAAGSATSSAPAQSRLPASTAPASCSHWREVRARSGTAIPSAPGREDPLERRLDLGDGHHGFDGARGAERVDDQPPGLGDFLARHRAQGPVTAGGGNGAGQHGGNFRFVDLDHDPGTGGGRRHPLEVAFHARCQRSRDVPAGAVVDQGPLPVVQVQAGGEAERPAQLDLDIVRRELPRRRSRRPGC